MVGITGTSHENQYIFMITSRLVLVMRVFSDKSCRDNKNTHLVFNKVFLKNRAVYEIKCESSVQPERPQMKTWHIRMACWIPRATDTFTLRCLHQECYRDVKMRLLCGKDALETVQNELIYHRRRRRRNFLVRQFL